ncbi:hypothetical protein UlMin_031476 [Ulmus minor]
MSQSESSSTMNASDLFKIVMRGAWDEVIKKYKENPAAQKTKITRSGYTALHLAVSDGKEGIVKELINVLSNSGQRAREALEIQNDAGNTPLHIAASMGNVRMCKLIARVDHTLIGIQNNDGETPLFLTALHGKKDAFLKLNSFLPANTEIPYCRRKVDGNSILHCAIAGEYFDLAFWIIQLCNDLVNYVNGEGHTPLHVLATKPSAFESGSNLGRFQKLAYKSSAINSEEGEMVIVKISTTSTEEKLEDSTGEQKASSIKSAEEEIEVVESPSTSTKEENCACEQKVFTGNQSALKTQEKDFLPPNYVTCFEFVKLVSKAMLVLTGYGGVTNILDEKRKHAWSVQVMDELLKRTNMYEYVNAGHAPLTDHTDNDIRQEVSLDVPELNPEVNPEGTISSIHEKKKKKAKGSDKKIKVPKTTKQDSAILIAAKHGIKEMVEKILEKFPVAIHDTDVDKKNMVLLIAVENRQLEVYKFLLKKYGENDGMFRKVDKDGNGALHFAAKHTKRHPRWPIPGDALQMQWEIKWLKFVEETKSKHFFVRYNSKGKTPNEIFTKTHKTLVKGGGNWMKSTAESCSLVAALIATVAFATSTALPGGIDDKSGKPHLETKPGFQVFAIASLIALCFSVTSLVMFLAILTSRYQEKDFGRNLPWKLLLGLTSLFVSIASMLVSFCAGHFFVLEDTIRYAAFPVYALTSIPVTFFAAAQFPLYFDLIRATFTSPFGNPTK